MLHDAIEARLTPLETHLAPEWQLWQHKTLNMHRGVIHWDATKKNYTLQEICDQVRGVVHDQFRPTWWRGFGFGAIVSLNHVDDSYRKAAELVDVRNYKKGVWQWILMHFPASNSALGICTWMNVFLTPVYESVLSSLQDSGVECTRHQRDVDVWIKALYALQDKMSVTRQILRTIDGSNP